MSAINETIVREFFELHGFHARQLRKHVASGRAEDAEIDFLVWHPQPEPAAGPLPLLLAPADLRRVGRAVVGVCGWHTEFFGAAKLSGAPGLFRFADPILLKAAAPEFDVAGPVVHRILVLPSLPQGKESRQASLELVRAKGVDAVLTFRTVLTDLIAWVQENHNYEKSDVLQLLRILKHHQFFREPQLDLFKSRRARRSARAAGAAASAAVTAPEA